VPDVAEVSGSVAAPGSVRGLPAWLARSFAALEPLLRGGEDALSRRLATWARAPRG
jgi:hypothetical protein